MRNNKINIAVIIKTDEETFNNIVKPILKSVERHEDVFIVGSIVSEMNLWVEEITDDERILKMNDRSLK